MDYKITIRDENRPAAEALFIHLLKVDSVDDFERGVRDAIAEWKRQNPARDLIEDGCSLAIDRA